ENPIVRNLHGLNEDINALRKDGEEILTISKEIDKTARGKVEKAIGLSQVAAMVLLPLFLVVGLGALFGISQGVVKRLKILTAAVEKTGKGDFLFFSVPAKPDDVDT
ncbi:MAG: hypothetical protein HY754_11490, partial [Nitrospirae bacterium]|nr:hypothetical protein [Nitrospirota bacterium]